MVDSTCGHSLLGNLVPQGWVRSNPAEQVLFITAKVLLRILVLSVMWSTHFWGSLCMSKGHWLSHFAIKQFQSMSWSTNLQSSTSGVDYWSINYYSDVLPFWKKRFWMQSASPSGFQFMQSRSCCCQRNCKNQGIQGDIKGLTCCQALLGLQGWRSVYRAGEGDGNYWFIWKVTVRIWCGRLILAVYQW